MDAENEKSSNVKIDNKPKKINTAAIRIAVFIAAIAAIVLAIVQFGISNDERISHLNATQVKDGTEKLANEVDRLISDRLANIKILSAFYSESLSSPEVDVELLRKMTEDSNFDFMEFADANGLDHNITGGTSDATDRKYYIDGMAGNTGLELIFESRATHETLLMFYSPVIFEGKPIGVMIGVIQATGEIAELIDFSYYDEKAKVFLCDENGDIVASSIPLEELDTRKQIAITDVLTGEQAVKAINSTISDGTTNVFEAGKEGDSIGCATKLSGYGWHMVEIFPDAAHNDLVNTSTGIATRLLIILLVVFIAVILAILITNIIDRKNIIEQEAEQMHALEQANSRMEEQLEVIEGLGSEYFSILLVDSVNDTVIPYRTKGEEGNIISEFFSRGGRNWSELIRIYADSLVLEEDRADFMECLCFKIKKDCTFNYRLIKDSGISWLQVRVAYVERKDGTNIAVIGTKNVDELVREEQKKQKALADALEAAEKANKAKSDFLFNMSHDIRTPMNAIIGYTDLLKKNVDNPELRDRYIENIQTSNGYLLDLINNVLDTARIESGKATLDEEPGDSYQIGKDLDTAFAGEIEKKHIKYTLHDSTVHRYVYHDATKMTQIMFNIMSNAVKYTPEGGSIDIYFSEEPSQREGWADFTTVVKDTGIGISKEFLPHIFDSFTRERSVTDSKIVGTGLGMGIVKRLIDLMGGTITVESELGKGTTVSFTVSHRIADAPAQTEHTDTAVDSRAFAGKRILLAEDNELNAEIAVVILGEAGFEVEHAEDGIVCVDMLNKSGAGYYDLILMDVQMPNMDGIKATTVIRQLPDKEKANTPIIAMTANAFEEDRKKCLEAGMNGFISKPIDIGKLMETLVEILK